MHTLNLGVLAHVDAGKTSLTERLLHAAGVVDVMGRVDDGTTQTDTLDLERRRGITLRAAVVSFVVGDTTVNLVDTPGHPDFIAEVDRALGVLDGAVLVVSAVEGVQAQTGLLLRALRRQRVPTLLFVNKVDRAGADPDRVLAEVAERLTPAIVPLVAVRGAGTPAAAVVDLDLRRAGAIEVLADHDDDLLAAYVAGTGTGTGLPEDRLRCALAEQTRRVAVHPVYMGSAATGAGVDRLMEGLTTLLPAAAGRPDEPLSATVFKVERGPGGERIAYVRMFAGTLRARTRVHGELVTGIRVFDRGPARPAPQVVAGQIAQLRGPTGLRVGDTLGEPPPPARRAKAHFAPPTLEAVIRPARPGDKGALHAALVDLAEQDPLIGLRQDDDRGELYVSLYGEVQKDVLRAMLDEGHGLAVELLDTTVACVERPVGTGHALEVRGEGGNPFEATVGIEIAPGPEGSGLVVRSIVEVGSIPAAYHAAVATTARAALRKGLHGWPVIDAVVTVTHCDHRPPPVPVGGFRDLTPIVTRAALARAGTVVCEPILRFRLDLPADTAAAVYVALARLGAVPLAQAAAAAGSGRGATIEGEIRAARLPELQQQVPGLTRGEGVLDAAFASYRRVDGPG